MFQEYGELSTQLYEFTKPIGHSIGGDLEYYAAALKSTHGKILEAGVGTGRIMIPLLQQGLQVEGVDQSSFMLERCLHHLKMHQLTAPLYQQSLQSLDLPSKYEAIIMPTGTFSLLPTREAMLKALAHFKDHLVIGGQLLIDLIFPTHFNVGKEQRTVFKMSESEGILFTSTAVSIDWEKQQTSELHRYEKWLEGELIQTELSNFILSWYGVEEFRLILMQLGFTSINICWDYGVSQGEKELVTVSAIRGDD